MVFTEQSIQLFAFSHLIIYLASSGEMTSCSAYPESYWQRCEEFGRYFGVKMEILCK